MSFNGSKMINMRVSFFLPEVIDLGIVDAHQ